jgi:undecaprenyl diphosphate synthase
MAEQDQTPPDPNLPRHVAMIMDGNGRWAKKRFLPRFAGHKAGLETVRTMVKACLERRIEVLTLFAFSSENWRRPPDEVTLLMDLFMTALDREVRKLHENGVRLRIIGDLGSFSSALQERIRKAEALTRENSALVLVIAANYGGRWDIARATQKIAEQVRSGELAPDAITAEHIAQELCLSDLPEPDLFVRTGGEQRVSNFLLWQLAYAELYFTPVLWPDFDEAAFAEALASFAVRQRRFGRTGDQVEQMKGA